MSKNLEVSLGKNKMKILQEFLFSHTLQKISLLWCLIFILVFKAHFAI